MMFVYCIHITSAFRQTSLELYLLSTSLYLSDIQARLMLSKIVFRQLSGENKVADFEIPCIQSFSVRLIDLRKVLISGSFLEVSPELLYFCCTQRGTSILSAR